MHYSVQQAEDTTSVVFQKFAVAQSVSLLSQQYPQVIPGHFTEPSRQTHCPPRDGTGLMRKTSSGGSLRQIK
jgi:hypothetical protein